MAGVVPPGEDRRRYRDAFIGNLRYAADAFAQHGIKVLIEALSPQVKPDYLFSSQHQAAELAAAVDRPNLFIQFDVFHAQLVDGDISGLMNSLAGRYAHIQIASVPERHEPDDGELNYPWLFAQLDASVIRLGRLRIPAARRYRRRARLGQALPVGSPPTPVI